MKPTIEKPKIFISYAWASAEYQEKVLSLATDLMNDGVDVLFDKWSLKEGNDTFAFMEHSVTDDSITNVLILLDPMYEQKANDRMGGVGTETQIISAEVYNKVTQEKFLPVIFERRDDGSVPKPAYLKGLLHFDLSVADKYDDEYQRLVRRLYGIDTYQKPEVGTKPAWLDVIPTVKTKTRSKAEELKKNNIPDKIKTNKFREMLWAATEDLVEFGNDKEVGYNIPLEEYLQLCEDAIPLRDEFLQIFLLVPYVNDGAKEVAECLESMAAKLSRDYSNSILEEIRKTILHELFIYLIAIYHRTRNIDALAYTINKTYFGPTYQSQMDGQSFRIFYNNNENLDKAVNKRDNKNYHCGMAQYWIEHINVEACSKADFVFADDLLYNAAMIISNYDDTWYWFPVTYIYGGHDNLAMRNFSIRMKSKEHLKEAIKIFGYTSEQTFIEKIKEIEKAFHEGKHREYRYNSCFENAPVICGYIKSEELGTKN